MPQAETAGQLLIAGYSAPVALWLGLALFLASWVRGYSGFGSSAIFLAAAALVTDPVPLIPAMYAMELAMTAVQGRGVVPHVDWRIARPVLAGALVATPVSVLLLIHMPPEIARLVVSGVILVLTCLLLAGWRLRQRPGRKTVFGAGIVAGLANTAGVGGLPIAAFASSLDLAPQVFRATMVAVLSGMVVIALPMLAIGGLLTLQSLTLAAFGLPILAAGIRLGSRRFSAAPPEEFRRFAMLLLLALSAAGVLRALF